MTFGTLKVGMTGFEPATPTSLTWCANRAALHPVKIEKAKLIVSLRNSSPNLINYHLQLLQRIDIIGMDTY